MTKCVGELFADYILTSKSSRTNDARCSLSDPFADTSSCCVGTTPDQHERGPARTFQARAGMAGMRAVPCRRKSRWRRAAPAPCADHGPLRPTTARLVNASLAPLCRHVPSNGHELYASDEPGGAGLGSTGPQRGITTAPPKPHSQQTSRLSVGTRRPSPGVLAWASLLTGSMLGICLGALAAWLQLFSVTGWLITLIAAGMAGQAAATLAGANLIPARGYQLWDTSWLLPENSLSLAAGRAVR